MCSNQQNYRDAHQNNFAENRIKSGFGGWGAKCTPGVHF